MKEKAAQRAAFVLRGDDPFPAAEAASRRCALKGFPCCDQPKGEEGFHILAPSPFNKTRQAPRSSPSGRIAERGVHALVKRAHRREQGGDPVRLFSFGGNRTERSRSYLDGHLPPNIWSSMRPRSTLLAALLVTIGTSVATAQSGSRAVPAWAVQFLVDSATWDIHAHHPPAGKVQFRNARIGTLPQPNGTTFYLVCAERAGVTEGNKPTWVPFVTIKMETYEQWLGEEAFKDWCYHRKPIWDPRTDITAALQAKYDSL